MAVVLGPTIIRLRCSADRVQPIRVIRSAVLSGSPKPDRVRQLLPVYAY
jgi:hypothetical protein